MINRRMVRLASLKKGDIFNWCHNSELKCVVSGDITLQGNVPWDIKCDNRPMSDKICAKGSVLVEWESESK